MHHIVELERVYFTAIPAFELDAKFAKRVAQITIVSRERCQPILAPAV